MKKLFLALIGAVPLAATAQMHTGVYNHSVPVQCNGWGWTGEDYNFTLWMNPCSSLEVQGGATIKTTENTCADGEVAEYVVTRERQLAFIRCTKYSR